MHEIQQKTIAFYTVAPYSCLSFWGCQKSEKSQVKAAATRELDLLKDLDDKTIEKYISYEDFYPSGEIHQEVSSKIKNIFSRFYENFSYIFWTFR